MDLPNSAGATFNLHLRDCGRLSVEVRECNSWSQTLPDMFVVSIGTGHRVQEACLFLEPEQLVQLANVLGTWALAIQAQDQPPQVGAVDPQQDDEMVDVRGDK